MFKFGKQKIKKEPSAPDLDSKLAEQIHVMPKRFYIPTKKKPTFLVIIIIVGVILIGGLASVAYYFYLALKDNQAPVPVNTNQALNTNQEVNNSNQDSNSNQNQNIDVNINANTNTATTTETNANTNVNINVNENINANININTNTDYNFSQPLPSAPDSDQDSLTLAEESLYGTNPEIGDSDGDGYTDGPEIINGYDPTRPALKLSDSGIFNTYNSPQYSIIYPAKWEVKKRDESEVLFTSTTGEFVEVLVLPNVNNYSLDRWYKDQFPEINLAQVTSVRINNLIGFRPPDQQNYYLMSENDKSKIFLLTYNTGSFTMTNFETTFQVMVKSFKSAL